MKEASTVLMVISIAAILTLNITDGIDHTRTILGMMITALWLLELRYS